MRIAICNWMENSHLAGDSCLLCVYIFDFYIQYTFFYVMYDLYLIILYIFYHMYAVYIYTVFVCI